MLYSLAHLFNRYRKTPNFTNSKIEFLFDAENVVALHVFIQYELFIYMYHIAHYFL